MCHSAPPLQGNTVARHLVTIAWPEQPAKTHGKVRFEREQQEQQPQFTTTKSKLLNLLQVQAKKQNNKQDGC
jgi:hypothetical protein